MSPANTAIAGLRLPHAAPQQLHDSSAEFNGIELPGSVVTQLAHDSVASATLFVVDTSDPSRSAVL